jgi:acyl carrier protein
MDTASTIQELQPIFQDVLDQPNLHLTPASNASNVEDWDSLAHISIVSAVEKHFRIKFTLAELQTLKNVGEMAELIQKKIQKQ